jgi:hypothetical protein
MEHSFKKLERLEKQNKAILNSWLSGANSSAAPTIREKDPNTGVVSQKPNPNHNAYKNVQDPRGQYSWLFSKPANMR